MLRTSFEKEGYVFPQIYWLEQPLFGQAGTSLNSRSDFFSDPYAVLFPFTSELLCFEKLLVRNWFKVYLKRFLQIKINILLL